MIMVLPSSNRCFSMFNSWVSGCASLLIGICLFNSPAMAQIGGNTIPSRTWSTYFGGVDGDDPTGVTKDAQGNVYACGSTESSTGVSTPGAYQTVYGGVKDGYLAKFDVRGKLLWSTYFGGVNLDIAHGVATDASGNVYLVGESYLSTNLSTTGAHQPVAAGFTDGFIAKFSPNGQLLWSTYYGGTDYDYMVDVDVDGLGNVYVGGYTTSSSGIATSGVFQPVHSAGYDLMLARFDTNGNRIWGTYIGGAGPDLMTDLDVNSVGDIAIGGRSALSPTITTAGAHSTTSNGGANDAYACRMDSTGNIVWGTYLGGTDNDRAFGVAINEEGDVYLSGLTESTTGIASTGAHQTTLANSPFPKDCFLAKFGNGGVRLWSTYYGGNGAEEGGYLGIRANGDVYISGSTTSTTGIGTPYSYSPTPYDYFYEGFLAAFDPNGNRRWGTYFNVPGAEFVQGMDVDDLGSILITGYGNGNGGIGTPGSHMPTHPAFDAPYIIQFIDPNVIGHVYADPNSNCTFDAGDFNAPGRIVRVEPGPYYSVVGEDGKMGFLLEPGTYTVSVDTSGPWSQICPTNPPTQTFTIANPDTFIDGIDFALFNSNPCPRPTISVGSGPIRPCFSNNTIYVSACNDAYGTGSISNSYVILNLDNLIPQSTSIPYTVQGDGTLRFETGTLLPGNCVDFTLTCSLGCDVPIGYTECVEGFIYPVDTCALDSPTPLSPPCTSAWDNSHLQCIALCEGDSVIKLIVVNLEAPMLCYRDVRIFVDGQLYLTDSVQLNTGDSAVYTMPADGRTWRIEADQHPLHIGNSTPSATVEACGDPLVISSSWIPGLVDDFPMDDQDEVRDIFCLETSASYDPNDKRGFPTGWGSDHRIPPDQPIDYMIRFQNTGTDTAFKVVITDTLPSSELDIFSFHPGVSSHTYTWTMTGPGVVEWTFSDIHLPDSNVNEPGSHGFVKFTIQQQPGLSHGTLIENKAEIYFDYNDAVITPWSIHQVWDSIPGLGCGAEPVIFWHGGLLNAMPQPDGATYQWFDCMTNEAVTGGTGAAIVPDSLGNYYVVVDNPNCSTPDTSGCFNMVLTPVALAQAPGFVLYPVPIEGRMWVEFGREIPDLQVRFFSLSGQLIYEAGTVDPVRRLGIDLEEVGGGMYFVEVIALGTRQFRKVIVK